MPKYAISPGGERALRALANTILTNANATMETAEKLQHDIMPLMDELGIYGEEILALVQKNKNALLANKEEIVSLSVRVKNKADEIQSLMSMGLVPTEGVQAGAGPTGGVNATNAATNGANSNQLGGDNNHIKEEYRAYLIATGLVGDADFGNLDQRTAKDMCDAIYETKQMFPELDLRFVGSLQARNTHLNDKLVESYAQGLRMYNPGASENEIQDMARQLAAKDLQAFQPSDRTIAQSLFVGEPQDFTDDIVATMNGITINEGYGLSYEHFVDVRRGDVDAGWKPQNCYSPKATVDHELGHQIAKLTDAHFDSQIQNLYYQFMNLDESQRGSVLSGYAADSIHEFIAESWSEYRNNPSCRDCARMVAERMIDLYNQNTPQKVLKRR